MSVHAKFYLFKRDNGFWYILVEQDGRKSWKSTRTRSKQEALRALTQLKDFLRPKPKPNLLQSFIEDFLCYAETTYSTKTVKMYSAVLNGLSRTVGEVSLGSLSAKHIDVYKAERLRAVSPVSVNIELRILKAALNVAVRWELLERNPFKDSPLVRVPEQLPRYFTREDLEKLLSLIKEKWLKEVVLFAVLTGMRQGEVLNLKWESVDLERRLIHVHSSSTFRTKSGKRRAVPISETVLGLLSPKCATREQGYVFTANGRRLRGAWVSHRFKHYVHSSGIEDNKLHFHSLRHTFATWLVREGVSIYEIQKLLGHSSIAVTQVYSHLAPEELHRAVDKISVSLN